MKPPRLGFQAVIKSAASAASPRTKNPRKNREKIEEQLSFLALLAANLTALEQKRHSMREVRFFFFTIPRERSISPLADLGGSSVATQSEILTICWPLAQR